MCGPIFKFFLLWPPEMYIKWWLSDFGPGPTLGPWAGVQSAQGSCQLGENMKMDTFECLTSKLMHNLMTI